MIRCRAVALALAVSAAGPLGCSAPPPSPPVAAARDTPPDAGVIVAIRESPGDDADIARVLRAAGIGQAAPEGTATREYIVVVDGRGPVSVVQPRDPALTVGQRVTVVAGARTRLAPGDPASVPSRAGAA